MTISHYNEERELILNAAASIFNERGLSHTTLSDVAQKAGFTNVGVAHHYATVQELAAACIHQTLAELDALLKIAEKEKTLRARLRRCAMLYFEQLAEVGVGVRPALINFWDMRALTGPHAEAAGQTFSTLFRRLRLWFTDPSGPSLPRSA